DARRGASRRQYVRLYREFLAIDPAPVEAALPVADAASVRLRGSLGAEPLNLELSSRPREVPIGDADLGTIAGSAKQAGYKLEFMVALVADPVDSRLASDFDLAMNALEQGLADAEYQFDRKWLPWADPDAAEQKAFRETAGVLLFRRDRSKTRSASLLAVFLVGETPKVGIHKPAFGSAVDFIVDLHEAATRLFGPPQPEPPRLEIPVLGPTYSGSADSLRIALRRTPRATCFRIVSGSATGQLVASRLTEDGLEERVRFGRTVVSDFELAQKGLGFLEEKLHWDLNRAALLIENDTAYGSSFLDRGPGAPPPQVLQKVEKWSFPSGLFPLRNAWEGSGAFVPSAQEIAANPKAFATPKTALDVSLADKRPPVDVVPELGPLTSRIDDMAVANLLRRIAEEKISYVGILATDVKDELFLAEQVRRWAPNVILFVIDSDLLYLHPQYSTAMFGALTLSSFPLATEGADSFVSPSVPRGEHRLRRQFSSEWQEGVFLAVEALAGRQPTAKPAVWIAATGNYAMWPLARVETDKVDSGKVDSAKVWSSPVEPVGPTVTEPSATLAGTRVNWDIQLLLLMLAVCLASHQLHRRTVAMVELLPRTRKLLSLSAALLCLPGAALAGIWSLGLWARRAGEDDPVAWLFLSLLLAGYGYLGWGLVRTAPLYRQVRAVWLVLLTSVVVVFPLLTWAAFAYWSLGSPELLHRRVRAFAGGLSPVVSLAWLALAFFFWLAVELRRQLVRERHKVPWPFGDDPEPALAGTRVQAQRLSRLLKRTFPRGYRLAAFLIVGAPALVLLARVQPIGESRHYGWIFVVLCAIASLLSVCSFLRFVAAWWGLRQLLRRIAETDLLEALERIAGEMDWKPMQFSWYVPSFTALRQTVERLQRLTKRGLVSGCGTGDELRGKLAELFQSAGEDSFQAEMELRKELRRHFVRATRQLASRREHQGVDDFYAVRLVAYLRLAFTQLRYSLMGAMGTGLPMILAAATYGFQPKRLAMLLLWSTLGVASAVTLTIFVQMDRDRTLSAIAGTPAGQVTYSWSFVSNALTYGILPVVGLVSSQFPSVGRLFSSLLDPLVRILGAG
nr:hypothetical protein [Acidobacteriota bacterium]